MSEFLEAILILPPAFTLGVAVVLLTALGVGAYFVGRRLRRR